MSDERFLVTGAMGCLGAWTVKSLVDEGTSVVAFDLSTDRRRLELLATPDELAGVTFASGDITDGAVVDQVVAEYGVTHVVHLAALQVPFCRADPPLGARVNVLGTVNVFEAAVRRRDHLRSLVYASSAAVFGPPEMYPGGKVADDSPAAPTNIYGVYKLANEGTATIYEREHGLGSVGLRPWVVYGPGRDQGMTSTPTVAMVAAAAGVPYHISYGGSTLFQYAPDAARAFIAAARAGSSTARTLNIGGTIASMSEIVAAIEAAAPDVAGKVTFTDVPIGVAEPSDTSALDELVGGMTYTPLHEGVNAAVESFRSLLARGLVEAPTPAAL